MFKKIAGALLRSTVGIKGKENPARFIVLGFISIILVGTILLMLPISSNNGHHTSFIDSLFTVTSAVCVTGLVVVETLSYWSPFGKMVILILIQIGGLGFMTIVTVGLLILGKKITLRDRIIIQQSLNQSNLHGMVRLIISVIKGTFIIEGIAAIILTIRFMLEPENNFIHALAKGIFHSVSAFCNAGFDIIGDSSLIPYVGDPVINIVIMFLIIAGGIGFSVWLDLVRIVKLKRSDKNCSWKKCIEKLSLHTKMVLSISGILIIVGAIFFFVAEFDNADTIKNLSLGDKIWASIFQSVSPRTAGFMTISQAGMEYASKFMTIILMAIGGSPGGTAGGIKTVTLGVALFSVISVFRGKNSIEAYKRNISIETLQKSLTIIFLYFGTIIISTMILTFTEKGSTFTYEFIDLLFETVSATATVGNSTGLTPHLSVMGRLVIIACMFIGRIGPVTVVVALALKLNKSSGHIKYPEEKILVG